MSCYSTWLKTSAGIFELMGKGKRAANPSDRAVLGFIRPTVKKPTFLQSGCSSRCATRGCRLFLTVVVTNEQNPHCKIGHSSFRAPAHPLPGPDKLEAPLLLCALHNGMVSGLVASDWIITAEGDDCIMAIFPKILGFSTSVIH